MALYIDTTIRASIYVEKDNGTALSNAEVTALTFSIYDRATNGAVNSRVDAALTPISTYLDTSGNIIFDLAPADNVMIDSAHAEETHRVIVKWTYTGGAKGATYKDYTIQNPRMVS